MKEFLRGRGWEPRLGKHLLASGHLFNQRRLSTWGGGCEVYPTSHS